VSAYQEIKTEFRDLESLVAALMATGTRAHPTGLTRDQIEVHPNGANLVGYHGDTRAQRAHVIVRRNHVGSAANDIGFELVDGRYVARISDFDRNHHGAEWQSRLSAQYTRSQVHASARRAGYRVTERQDTQGRMILRLSK
jgi:hypothetical protein